MNLGKTFRKVKYAVQKDTDEQMDQVTSMLKKVATARKSVDIFITTLAAFNASVGKMNEELPLLYPSSGGGRLSKSMEVMTSRNDLFTSSTSLASGVVCEMNGSLDAPMDVITGRLQDLKRSCVERNNCKKDIDYYKEKIAGVTRKVKFGTDGEVLDPAMKEKLERNKIKLAEKEEEAIQRDKQVAEDLERLDEDIVNVIDEPLEQVRAALFGWRDRLPLLTRLLQFLRMQASYYKNCSEMYAASLVAALGGRASNTMVSSFDSTPAFGGGGGGAGDSAVAVPRMGGLQVDSTEAIIADYDYEASEPDELSFRAGDLFLLVSEKGGDGWWIARRGGAVGLVPSTYVAKVDVDRDRERETVRVLFDFDAVDACEVSVLGASTVKVLSKLDPQWTLVLSGGVIGYIPHNHCQGGVPAGFEAEAAKSMPSRPFQRPAAPAARAAVDSNPFDDDDDDVAAPSNPFGGGGIEL